MRAIGAFHGLWWPGILVWVTLMALLGLTWGLAYVPMGVFNTVVSMGIGTLKALLVALFFMHLKESGPVLRLAACAGLVWLAVLFAFTFADYLSRGWGPG
ncbi:MAG: cytochrome C oxidase subunit IV family protein [Geminicoccaceae bacterium]|nr:cytochrome C oxidase subunit IV family protein [Geminicoccaceae bacterium]